MRGTRIVIAVAGGRGGAGKSTLVVNLGVYLAQLGRSAVLIDADPEGAQLHTLLGIPQPCAPYPLDGGSELDPADDVPLTLIQTAVPGLQLSPQTYALGSTLPTRPGRKPRWARLLRQLDADYVILDLGGGTSSASLDLFLTADLGLCVTTPDPPSVETTYRFTRALFQRRLRRVFRGDRFRMRLAERGQMALQQLPNPVDLVQEIAKYDTHTAEIAASELSRLNCQLVVNKTRVRQDSDLGPAMVDMSRRFLGVPIDYLGHIEHDDAVRLSVVRRRPLLIDGPTSKSSRNLERIARRVLATATTRSPTTRHASVSLSPVDENLYEVLGAHRAAADDELRRAYKQQKEHYQPGSLPITSLVLNSDLPRLQQQVEKAHDTLLDSIRRRAYDASTFPIEIDLSALENPQEDAAAEAERAMLRQELADELNPDTLFTGALLRKVRESRGVELKEISEKTKISTLHLQAIELDTFNALPALVYTRGFIQQLAKHLDLDPTQVARSYLRRMRDASGATGSNER